MSRLEIRERSSLRRLADLLLGLVTLVVGVLMIFTPGPASLVIPLALALLGREFRWARQSSLVLRRKLRRVFRGRRAEPTSRRLRSSKSPRTRAA